MSQPSAEQVDSAVRAVLAGSGRPARPACLAPARFDGRLLSYRQVEALAPGVRELAVAAGTVITPLAHDHLKRLGITVRFVASEPDRAPTESGEWGFAIDDGSGTAAALRQQLLAGPERWTDVGPDALSAARWVALGSGRGAVVVTDEASVAAWAANQVPTLRAAAVHEPDAARRAARALGANLLVVEPAGKSIAWLRQIVRAFRTAGTPRPPAWLSRGRAGA